MAAPLFSRAVPASTRMSIIKMSRQDLMPNLEPELVPEQRIKLSLDFRGRKRSFYLPVWLLVLLAAAVIVLLALVGIYGFGGGNAADARLVKELRQQNKYLGSRIAEYEIELDSLASLLDSLGFATSEEQDYPYYSGRDEEARSKLRGTPDLAKQLNSLDRKLSQLWDRLGVEAPFSTGEAEARGGDLGRRHPLHLSDLRQNLRRLGHAPASHHRRTGIASGHRYRQPGRHTHLCHC